MRYCKIEPNSVIAQILEKVAESKIPQVECNMSIIHEALFHSIMQSPRMKLRHNGFKGYYYIWKKHYPQKFG